MKGFSLFELAIALIAMAIMATVLLDRLAYYEELAEKAKMEATISALKSAMRTRMATMMIEGRVQETTRMIEQNPVDWLERKPDDYRGAFSNPGPAAMPDGGWYFDGASKTLVYLVRNGRHFQPDQSGLKRVRLKVVPVFNRVHEDPSSQVVQPTDTVALGLVEKYRWLKDTE